MLVSNIVVGHGFHTLIILYDLGTCFKHIWTKQQALRGFQQVFATIGLTFLRQSFLLLPNFELKRILF